MTLVVSPPGASPQSPGARSPTSRDPEEWRLASADPRDQGKQKYRLHTLDIYFWTAEDAKQVTDWLKKLLHSSQLDLIEAEQPAHQEQHHEDVAPVVRNLENVALSDPAYRDGRTRNSQNQPQTQPSPIHAAARHSGEAAAQSSSPVSQMSSVGRSDSAKPHDPAAFTPLAYNPAAPPAPEPIAHREKTPPPPDAADGTGLGAAVHDAPYRPGMPQSNAPYMPGAPGPIPNMYGHIGSPPPVAGPPYGSPPPQGRTSGSSVTPSFGPTATPSFGPPPTLSQTISRHSSTAQQYAPPPKDNQPYAQPVETPGTQFYNSLPPPDRHQSLAHVQPQYADYLSSKTSPQAAPIGGYSDYQYHAAGQPVPGSAQQQHGSAGDIHSQVYRPTEGEAHTHGHDRKHRSSNSGKASAFDRNADKIEKKAGGWLKKLEKKIG